MAGTRITLTQSLAEILHRHTQITTFLICLRMYRPFREVIAELIYHF
jgi:hypothetical protein